MDTTTPFVRVVATGVVDEDPPHDLCGDTKEMRPTPPIDLPLIDESQIHFVDERRRLQRVPHPLAAKLAARNAAQLGIHQRQYLIECTVIPAIPIVEQRRDVRRCGHHYLVEGLKQQQDSGDDPANSSIPSNAGDPIVLPLRDLRQGRQSRAYPLDGGCDSRNQPDG